jgi:hypothetical protein
MTAFVGRIVKATFSSFIGDLVSLFLTQSDKAKGQQAAQLGAAFGRRHAAGSEGVGSDSCGLSVNFGYR